MFDWLFFFVEDKDVKIVGVMIAISAVYAFVALMPVKKEVRK